MCNLGSPTGRQVSTAVDWRVMLTVLAVFLVFSGSSAAGQNLSEVLFSQSTSDSQAYGAIGSTIPWPQPVGFGSGEPLQG